MTTAHDITTEQLRATGFFTAEVAQGAADAAAEWSRTRLQ